MFKRKNTVLMVTFSFIFLVATGVATGQSKKGKGGMSQVERGRYLSIIGGCNDCHSPKVFTPQGPVPDTTRLLSGHPANNSLPGLPDGIIGMTPDKWGAVTTGDLTGWKGPWGASFAANLTPDKETGLGSWTPEMFIKAMHTGKHMGTGRDILPPMPWFSLAQMTEPDLKALFAYLQSLKPVSNAVPDPIPPAEAPNK
jgi:hypothetical protein